MGLTNVKPLNAPKLKPVVDVPEPDCVDESPFVSVMLPLIPPLTAIEMLDNVCPSRLNCGQSTAAETSSVGPLTVPQFTTNVLAEPTTLNSNTAAKTKNA